MSRTEPLRLHYISDAYGSLQRVAQRNRQLLRGLCEEVATPQAAEVVVLHVDLRALAPLLQRRPILRRRFCVGLLVWETDRLPSAWQRAVQSLDEVWTPSTYCQKIFARVHPQVRLLPHTIDPPLPIPRAAAARFFSPLELPRDAFVVLTVTKPRDLRKNDALLQQACAFVRRHRPRMHLLQKTLTLPGAPGWRLQHLPGHTIFDANLPRDAMAALYRRADAYASAHHSEGWGLPLADALAAGLPVVAPAYSGNCDFLTPQNSLPVRSIEAPIGDGGQRRQFMPEMRWGHPCRDRLERQLLRAYDGSQDHSLRPLLAQGQRDVRRFDAAATRRRLGALLSALQLSL